MKLAVSLFVFLVGVAASATATPIFYNISFAGSGSNPTAGSFAYDADVPVFSDFIVVWLGITFDLTEAANLRVSQGGACDTPGPGPADAFAYLSNPTCGSGSLVDGWQASTEIGGPTIFTFRRTDLDVVDHISWSGEPDFGIWGPRNITNGTFSISAAVPEPTSLALLLSGGTLLAWKRRGRQSGPHGSV